MQTLGERLKLIQKDSGKTLPEFARSLGVSRDSLINYQQNRTAPDSRFLSAICEKYGVNPTWLLLGQGDAYIKEEKAAEEPPAKVVYFDDAVEILMEAEKEAGVTLNEYQRQNVLKVLRKELAIGKAKAIIRAVKEEEE